MGDHDTIRLISMTGAVISQNRVRNNRCRCMPKALLNANLTPLAANTCTALASAASDNACVSIPINRGPEIPLL